MKHTLEIGVASRSEHKDGGTQYGLSQQQIDDAPKHGIEALLDLDHRFASYMGRNVHETAKSYLKRMMILLKVFEDAGRVADNEGRFLSWTVPITNFPVVQYYIKGRTTSIFIPYGPSHGPKLSTNRTANCRQITVTIVEETIQAKGRQALGVSPNVIHSLDAAHLILTIKACDFPITTIHDSYGALLCDLPRLFVNVRKTFVELYRDNPIYSIMEQIGADVDKIEFGNLDVSSVLQSDFAFS